MAKYFHIFIIVIAVQSGSPLFGFNADSLFTVANRDYANKNYSLALENYQRLEKNNYISASLYFNIGNCYFKNAKIGYAILYYLRAQRLNPQDNDINSNLTFARQFMPTSLEGVKINPVTAFIDTLVAPFTLNTLAWLSSILFILLTLFLSALVYSQYRGLTVRIAGYILLFLLIISVGITSYKYRSDYLTQKGVIVADQAQIFSGPGEDNNVEFVGAFGLTFEVEKTVDKYYLVTFENQRKGWIKKADIEIL